MTEFGGMRAREEPCTSCRRVWVLSRGPGRILSNICFILYVGVRHVPHYIGVLER